MAGKAAGGADGGPVRAQAPPAGVDSKEQRRPSATRHSLHLRPCGRDGGAAGDRAHLRGGPAATAVWLPSRVGRQNRAWFKTCQFQVTPEIDRALMLKGFLVLGVT